MSTPDLSQIVLWLAPVLPYLLKGAVELAKNAAGELGKKLGNEGWEGLKGLAAKIQKKAAHRPALRKALSEGQAAPDDVDVQAALRLQLEKVLQQDPDLQAEVVRLLAGTSASGGAVVASGERSVAIGGDVRDSVIITGDGNRVTKA